MNPEQIKVKRFFEKFVNKGVFNSMSWMAAGLCTCFFVMLCFLPVQDMWTAYMEGDDGTVMLLLMLSILGPSAAWLRIQPYAIYGENQRNRKVSELLQYHPIDQKEIKKLRIFYLSRFMAKVTVACMVVQIPVTLGEYGGLSWMNFGYIFFLAFLWPVGYNAVGIILER